MSRLNPDLNQNPSKQFYSWNGERGTVKYYDKEAEEEVNLELPFAFLPLEIMARVSGWSQEDDASIWSNEVKDITQEPLHVRTGKGRTIAKGLYQDIKDKVKGQGGRYHASIYIAYYNADDELQIGNLQLKGAALSAWMDFQREVNVGIYEKAVVISDREEHQNGNVTYYTPVFRLKEVSEQAQQKSLELTKTLMAYLESRKPVEMEEQPTENGQQPDETAEAGTVDSDVELDEQFEDIDDDLPF